MTQPTEDFELCGRVIQKKLIVDTDVMKPHLQIPFSQITQTGAVSAVLLLIFLLCSLTCHASQNPQILILNSYHKGYGWSDGVVDGIESTISHQYPDAQISIEYLDTKRNSSQEYMAKLTSLFAEKYKPGQYDLIIATDDNGINFALKNRDQFFGDVPMVLCGANKLNPREILRHDRVTGVLEHSDIESTIKLGLQLLPKTKRIYIINDKTVTGQNVQEALLPLTEKLTSNVQLHYLDDLPLTELEKQVGGISGDAIILLLAYLRDKNGFYYEPEETASKLSNAAKVPIFSVWDFFFNHGIVGGVLTLSHLHGEAAGEIAIKILSGTAPKDIPIVANGGNRMIIDYRQLQRLNLDHNRLPNEAIVKNITYQEQKNVLVLLSYSLMNRWNKSILAGIEETFSQANLDIKLAVEFMDTKRFSDKAYLARLSKLYQLKYNQQTFDAVMVSDDNAFQFLMRNRNQLVPDAPIVFCGVNYLEQPEQYSKMAVTGIMESYDILGTIQLGTELFPETKKIYVINDYSTSGKANLLKLQAASPSIPDNLKLELCGEISMQDLLARVDQLEDDTLILLMSFTMDKNNQRFSYENSLKLIHGQAKRPILGFWDFYLGEGIVGGVITSGMDQGRYAAAMVLEILEGKQLVDMPVQLVSPVKPTLDFTYLDQFEWNEKNLSPNYKLLNKEYTFYERNRNIVYVSLAILAILSMLILAQSLKIILQKKEQKHLTEKASTDDLTGAKNRSFFLTELDKQMKVCRKEKNEISICYIDIDNLKTVNDTYGHSTGDRYILHAIDAIRKFIRSEDVLSRLGGDEFVVTLAGRSRNKLESFGEDINRELADTKRQFKLPYDLGISCGFSTFEPYSDITSKDLLERADQAMYEVKKKRKEMRNKSKL